MALYHFSCIPATEYNDWRLPKFSHLRKYSRRTFGPSSSMSSSVSTFTTGSPFSPRMSGIFVPSSPACRPLPRRSRGRWTWRRAVAACPRYTCAAASVFAYILDCVVAIEICHAVRSLARCRAEHVQCCNIDVSHGFSPSICSEILSLLPYLHINPQKVTASLQLFQNLQGVKSE